MEGHETACKVMELYAKSFDKKQRSCPPVVKCLHASLNCRLREYKYSSAARLLLLLFKAVVVIRKMKDAK